MNIIMEIYAHQVIRRSGANFLATRSAQHINLKGFIVSKYQVLNIKSINENTTDKVEKSAFDFRIKFLTTQFLFTKF